MKRIILAVGLMALSGAVIADQYVRPYVKGDGTYVEGHMRSSPNNNRFDNYSTQGNTNPYTGERGYQDLIAPRQPSINTLPDHPRPRRGF